MNASGLLLTDEIVDALKRSTCENKFWARHLQGISATGPNAFVVHLALLLEPYLQLILDGSKTIESRFSKNRVPPFGVVQSGDILLLRRVGVKGLSGICLVSKVWYYHLDDRNWSYIKHAFSTALCANDSSFWENRMSARFATLMKLSEVNPLPAIEIPKRDRRGWAILHTQLQQVLELSGDQPK